MRYGVISDVHANLPALEAVLAALEREGAAAYACAGDVVGYGASPNECVDRLRELGAVTVAGNHDLVASGRQGDARCDRLARETLRWTRRALHPEAAAYLAALPLHAEPAAGVVVAHGSLHDPWRYVARPAAAMRELDALAHGRPDAWLLVLGHTHLPLAFARGQGPQEPAGVVELAGNARWLLNPGAVGQSRETEPLARGLVVDLDARQVRFLAVEYDVEAARTALRRAGLPQSAVHRPPAPARARGRGDRA